MEWLNAETKKKIEKKLTKMAETPKNCESCCFADNQGMIFRCHRNPPAPSGGFAIVYNDDWCGEYKMRISKED